MPNKNIPLIVVNVGINTGSGEMCDEFGPSKHNPTEVLYVLKYVNLVSHFLEQKERLERTESSSKAQPNPYHSDTNDHVDNIGIIAPYKKQIQKIREFLKEMNAPKCRVGSVEEYQGQERKAIILSTVRSRIVNNQDCENIGFLHSEKRFNVAITRAQSLLIVISSVESLSVVPCWKKFFEFAKENGCIINV